MGNARPVRIQPNHSHLCAGPSGTRIDMNATLGQYSRPGSIRAGRRLRTPSPLSRLSLRKLMFCEAPREERHWEPLVAR
jgi:hypothetical protein